MRAAEFCNVRDALYWTNTNIADQLECDRNLVIRWANGKATIPPSVARWLTGLATYHERHPAPTDWRVRERK